MGMLNTGKKKIVAGATGLVLVAGGGAVTYAGTDIGAQIQDWYNNQFNEQVEDGKNAVVDYGKNQAKDALDYHNQLKADAGDSINTAKTSEIQSSKGEISDEKKERIANLRNQKENIEGSMDEQFNDLFQKGKAALNDIKDEAKTKAKQDLRNSINNDQDEAINEVNEKLNTKTDEAVEDLQEAIAKAKGDLSDKLDNKSEKTESDLKAAIDNAIKDVQDATSSLSDKLVAESEDAIAQAANNKVQDAKDSMDQVVAEMNK